MYSELIKSAEFGETSLKDLTIVQVCMHVSDNSTADMWF